jgi:hypothetical protein
MLAELELLNLGRNLVADAGLAALTAAVARGAL